MQNDSKIQRDKILLCGGQYCQRVVQITDRPKTQSLKSLQMLSLIASEFNHSCFVKKVYY